MAAIYSGIHLKLKSPHTPWEDKLKLARFAWISCQCLLPNKEQVLLDWCTYALTGWYNKKVQFSQNVLEGLWRYLDDFLHSRKLQIALKQGKTVSVRLNMAQLLLDLLEECAGDSTRLSVGVSTLLSVCQGVLSSPAVSSIFTTKYDLMVSLSVKVCSFACRQLQQALPAGSHQPDFTADTVRDLDSQSDGKPKPELEENKPKENNLSAHLFELLLQVLTSYLSVQRQQANPNRVLTLVTNQMIQPLVVLRHMVTSAEYAHSHTHLRLSQQLCRDVRVKIDSILQLSLFSAEHLASYKEELLPSKEGTRKRGTAETKGPPRPANALLCKLGSCEPLLIYSVRSNTIPLLYKFFLESYRKARVENEEEQAMLCFYFLTRLVPALDLCPSSSPCSPESWSLALLAVESLLSQALCADIYNVTADRIRHAGVQFNFYRSLVRIFFNQAQPSIPAWYRCLKVLLGLNHLILEPDLDELLSSAWVDAECMEVRVQRARQLMLCSVLQTYTKLRQLPFFFSELLSVICRPSLDNLRPPLLCDDVSASLTTSVLDTPPSQGLEICSLVLDRMKKYIIPNLLKEVQQAEIDGDNSKGGDQEKEDASLKLFSLSQLLHVVLFSLKTIDDASPRPLVRQAQSLMEEMQQVLSSLQRLLPTEKTTTATSSVQKKKKKKKASPKTSKTVSLWEQKTQEAVLLLSYTWGEVDTLFHLHCSKYTSFDSTEIPGKSEILSDASALTNIENLLHPFAASPSCSPFSFVHLKLRTLQYFKKVLFDSASLMESSTAESLNSAARFIIARDELYACSEDDHAWDGQMSSVDSSTYRVAHWYIVTTNLPLLTAFLNQEDMRCIVDILVCSLLRKQSNEGKDQLSISHISSELLQSSILVELPSLFSATVGSLTQRIMGVLTAADVPKICQTLEKYREAGELRPSLLVEDIKMSSQSGQVFVFLSYAQTKELIDLLQILSSLNPDGLNSEDLSSLFLLLTFILTSASCQSEASDLGDCTGFLGKLLRMLACLVEGRNFQSVLKIIYGSTLLQAVVSSLFWRSRKGQFSSTSNSDWLELMAAMQDFITFLVQLIIVRNSSVRLNLDSFASFLISKENTSNTRVSGMSLQLLLGSLASFSKVMNSNMGRNKQLDDTLTQLLTKSTSSLGPHVELVLKARNISEPGLQPVCILSPAFVVDTVTTMLWCELSSNNRKTLKHNPLYQSFSQQILKEMNSAARPVDFLVSSLNFLSAFYKTAVKTGGKEVQDEDKRESGMFRQIIRNVHRLLSAPWLSPSETCELEPAVQDLLRHLVENITSYQLSLLLLMIRDGLDTCKLWAGNYKEVLAAITIAKLLFCCQLPDHSSRALWLFAPQILSAMVFLVRSSSQDLSLTLTFTTPTVTAMVTLLRQGEGLIDNPHHVALVLGALQVVPLEHLSPSVYQSAFLAVHEALFAIIQCHTQVMLNTAPSFLNVFYRLVSSIMQEGRQRGDGDAGGDSEVYLQCSRLVERMYSHIAAISESFTTLSAFMVAQYVTELQKVTLRPEIKLHLTEGIYQILDLCIEQDIKFLTAGLPSGVREVLNELYSSYTHYHKTQRQGEDKYTV
ncbi:unhealthy ribosome biogenesis protein 2 homolog isoform X2 [Dunckerocampus dactyliophorus]|nr:unhealthy ribosome biogenesis protein 2 homolog isoform X2 [Dunckerocampus dactyliophorus]XP_054627420.1 unhealthy ribosome biogenesis protein 2 homolog isoform X2 [Dunckerocampus dactyliophorus]XP_054627421.1 unhealthy ribosome biogenesis protein 2 homolog isoform X2 [Dunckerocampus dactyliophorus]